MGNLRAIMMISRRFKILQMVLMLLAIVSIGVPTFAATKNEAVALAQDIMKVTVDTRGLSTEVSNGVRDSLIDIVMKRQ